MLKSLTFITVYYALPLLLIGGGLYGVSHLGGTPAPTAAAAQQQADTPAANADPSGAKIVSDHRVKDLWQTVVPKLDSVQSLETKQDKLPDNAWIGPDKASNQQDINSLLDEVIMTLGGPTGQDYRSRIRQLQDAIRIARNAIDQAQEKRLFAPSQGLWETTVSDYDAAIQRQQDLIQRYQQRIDAIKRQFAADLRGAGIAISDSQLDFLLSTVTGDEYLGLGIAFDNVKAIIVQLEQLLVDSGESIDSARRYYGLYVLLLKTLDRMHQQMLETVAGNINKINDIIERTGALQAQSKALRQSDQRHEKALTANLEAQQITLNSARLYRDYLQHQANAVSASRAQLTHDLQVAQNTYETVKVSGELVELMKTGQQMLDSLFQRELPTQFIFQNLEMKREFEKLTTRLQEDEKL
ncbi:MAG: hypothetical protein U1F68_18125 [Gammaproteobacteria bacterium]